MLVGLIIWPLNCCSHFTIESKEESSHETNITVRWTVDGLEKLCSDGQFFLLGGSAYLNLQQVATQSTLAPLYQYHLLVPLLAASFLAT